MRRWTELLRFRTGKKCLLIGFLDFFEVFVYVTSCFTGRSSLITTVYCASSANAVVLWRTTHAPHEVFVCVNSIAPEVGLQSSIDVFVYLLRKTVTHSHSQPPSGELLNKTVSSMEHSYHHMVYKFTTVITVNVYNENDY